MKTKVCRHLIRAYKYIERNKLEVYGGEDNPEGLYCKTCKKAADIWELKDIVHPKKQVKLKPLEPISIEQAIQTMSVIPIEILDAVREVTISNAVQRQFLNAK